MLDTGYWISDADWMLITNGKNFNEISRVGIETKA
jgi:hypothetical protein